MTTKKNKTAIILIGGGMRSVYSAGYLSALANKLAITTPDIMIASSADCGNTLYFCAGQYASLKRVWLDLLSSPYFISPKRISKIMDVDYLIDTVFKKEEPLLVTNVQSSPIDWYIALTDIDHGVVRYVHKSDSIDIFELLRAGKAIPLLYNKKITLPSEYGTSRYFDGEFGATLSSHVQQAVSAGATRILIIKNNLAWGRGRKIAMKLYMYTLPARTRLLIRQDMESSALLESLTPAYSDITIKMYSPNVHVSTATRSAILLKQAFEQGENDAIAMGTELRELFTV